MPQLNKLIGLKRRARKDGWTKEFSPNDEHALLQGCYFDEEAGHLPIEFIESFCVQSSGRWAGQPLILLDFQKQDIILPLYGWMGPDGFRRYRHTYITMAKKNTKSTTCSALSIVGLVADGEAGAEIYSAATSKDQAAIVYNDAANMVENSPHLSSILQVIRHTKTIRYGNNAWIKALSSDAPSSEGLKIYYLIIDELHVWKDPTFLNSLRWGSAARKQPLRIDISTVGDDYDTLWGKQHIYAKKVESGEVINIQFLPVIYCTPPDADVDDPKTHEMGNPALGDVISREDFVIALNEARDMGPSDFAQFKRYRLNMEGVADAPYLPIESLKQSTVRYTEEELREFRCWAAFDLSANEDTTAYVLVFDTPEGPYFRFRIYVPQRKVDFELKNGRHNYQNWVKSGHLIAIPGFEIDQDVIKAQIIEDLKFFQIVRLFYDKWNSSQMVLKLKGLLEMVLFDQNYENFSSPTKQLKVDLKSGKVHSDGNQCAFWQLANLHVDEDNRENVKPVKKKRGKRFKIDAGVAGIMCYSGYMTRDTEERSRFETEENPEILVF